MLGQIIIYNQGVLAIVHEVLAHGAAGERRDVGKGCWVRCARYNHDSVLEGIVLSELSNNTGDFGFLLANSHIDTNHIFAFLVDDSIYCDGGLAGLAVANDKFALTLTNRNHGINGLNTGLKRLMYGFSFHNAWSDAFNWISFISLDFAFVIKGFS